MLHGSVPLAPSVAPLEPPSDEDVSECSDEADAIPANVKLLTLTECDEFEQRLDPYPFGLAYLAGPRLVAVADKGKNRIMLLSAREYFPTVLT